MITILQNANGSTFQEVSKRNFRPIKIVAPAQGVLAEFNHATRPTYERIVQNQKTIDSLMRLRNTLLPRLVSGQLRVNTLAKGSVATQNKGAQ